MVEGCTESAVIDKRVGTSSVWLYGKGSEAQFGTICFSPDWWRSHQGWSIGQEKDAIGTEGELQISKNLFTYGGLLIMKSVLTVLS